MKSLQIDAHQYLDNANSNIEKNIEILGKDYFGLCAQNILAQTRNLLEALALIDFYDCNPEFVSQSGRDLYPKAVSHMKSKVGRNKWFIDLYSYIEKSSSHLTQSEYDSEVLLGKYLYYMRVFKHQVKKLYGIDILKNIYDIPFIRMPKR